MDIKDLRTFLAVADARSFLKAADTLFISRQGISKTIQKLEEELRTELFVRNRQGAMLTPAGVFLYSRASALVAEMDKLKADTMNVNRSYRPVLHYYLSQGIYSHFAPKLHAYGEQYQSEMDLQFRACFDTDVERLLSERRAEAVLSFLKPNQTIARSVTLLRSPIVFLMSKSSRYTDPERPQFRDLAHAPMLLYTAGLSYPLWWYNNPAPKDICCGDLDYLFYLLEQDKGVIPIPEIALPSYLDCAVQFPAPSTIESVPVYYSIRNPDQYGLLEYNLMELVYDEVFEADQ